MPRQVILSQIYRVIDANYNRAKEGLRVCEDVCRFVEDDPKATARFKKLRHGLTAAVAAFGLKGIVASRDIVCDVGRKTFAAESRRTSVGDIFYANAQRVKESLRVLEEFAKLKDPAVAVDIKKLRYTVYEIEKNALKRI
jgi:thiamine-phosphate pyrophosphorylase